MMHHKTIGGFLFVCFCFCFFFHLFLVNLLHRFFAWDSTSGTKVSIGQILIEKKKKVGMSLRNIRTKHLKFPGMLLWHISALQRKKAVSASIKYNSNYRQISSQYTTVVKGCMCIMFNVVDTAFSYAWKRIGHLLISSSLSR